MAFSDFGSTTSVRPDKPLVIKCTFDQRMKRITFASSRNCSYDLLRARVEQCFALSATPFMIRYKDDDGEVTDVTSDGDLTEAIQYFHVGDDLLQSSASSIISGRSSSGRKVTLRLTVIVDSELSLSDTASLASQEDYNPNASDLTLAREPFNCFDRDLGFDDDAVTVSSHDTGPQGAPALRINSRHNLRSLSPVQSDGSPVSSYISSAYGHQQEVAPSPTERGTALSSLETDSILESSVTSSIEKPLTDVFDRLKRLEGLDEDEHSYQEAKRLSQTERGVQWLKDQNVRAIQSMFGALPEPSISDNESIQIPDVDIVGDLALQQDEHGKYYYAYTSSSGASHAPEEAFLHDGSSVVDSVVTCDEVSRTGEPSPRGLAWIADQRAQASSSSHAVTPNPFKDPSPQNCEEYQIPPEVLQYLPENHFPVPPPEEITNCSSCGLIMESFRYVCTTCGELEPHPRHVTPTSNGKGKARDISPEGSFTYPPRSSHSPCYSPASSSWTLLNTGAFPPRTTSLMKPLPSPPIDTSRPRGLYPSSSQDTLYVPPSESSNPPGYELCSNCIESIGVTHALETSTSISSHSNSPLSSSQENLRNVPQLRRNAPFNKGHLRHAFREKVWGHGGWKDVAILFTEHDLLSTCSICKTSPETPRYKCFSCPKFDLCRACYSQVHEIHPSHAFLSVPEQTFSREDNSENTAPRQSLDINGELSLIHPGVKCHHCLLDIVGARFHCAVCDSVDICSNCESAGLPGNLTSPDGGHDSSHIMIKIPFPIKSTEVENVSRHAISLWRGRDGPVLQGRRRSNSQDSTHARTVIGQRTGTGNPHLRRGSNHSDDHQVRCQACRNNIVGVRFQCASCPSAPASFDYCESCERRSYLLHDPKHIFLKIPRLVDRPIRVPGPLVPLTLYVFNDRLTAYMSNPSYSRYSTPAGFIPGPYIQSLYHRTAVCDRCIQHIRGVWLRCAYCGTDLCEDCEAMGGHEPTHVFLMFKSMVGLSITQIWNIDDPSQSPPIIPHPIYLFN
ncbi:hypothetical protein BU17DRAFT_48255 [Hysterangium stoloniferum]|nr:hypothetical protein BU17DRAFT_48255 [Hysterangium stoloniferum]